VSGVLLDVNVLIAAAWPGHQAHEKVQTWVPRHARRPSDRSVYGECVCACSFECSVFAKCTHPGRCTGFVASQLGPSVSSLLGSSNWLPQAVRPFAERIVGHYQASDAYLLGLAIHKERKPGDPGLRHLDPVTRRRFGARKNHPHRIVRQQRSDLLPTPNDTVGSHNVSESLMPIGS